MNIQEELLPLLDVVAKPHSINTKEECIKYIDEILEALEQMKEVRKAFNLTCSDCIHSSICKIQNALRKEEIDNFLIDIFKLAWICKKYYKDPIYNE